MFTLSCCLSNVFKMITKCIAIFEAEKRHIFFLLSIEGKYRTFTKEHHSTSHVVLNFHRCSRNPLDCDCRIRLLHLCRGARFSYPNKCHGYDTKSEKLQFWITASLRLLPGPLWPGVEVAVRILFRGKTELFIHFLKLVDKFTYLGTCVSSTETDINMRLAKTWTVIDKLSVVWKSDLTDKIKRSFFQAAIVLILQ